MIRYLEVDGFRSLVRFKLELRPGLNLLIGPNGGGKTNIISFLAFISESVRSGLSLAVSNLGGSGSVFRKHGERRYHSQIRARVCGRSKPDQEYARYFYRGQKSEPDNRVAYFEYSFTIQLSEDREKVYFVQQNLKLHMGQDGDGGAPVNKWDADVQLTGSADGSVVCNHARLSPEIAKEFGSYRRKKNVTPEETIQEMISAETSIIQLVGPLLSSSLAMGVLKAFSKGSVFNPHPSRIRLPEDSAKSPGIRPDGSGLYASLFALKKGKSKTEGPFIGLGMWPGEYVPFEPSIKLDRLLEYFRLAYPAITNLKVTNDQFENTIRARVTLEGADKPQIPMAALSDGTLKWMALVTAVYTNSGILAIEEPENFVHPFVQRETVRVTRERLQGQSFLLMSSHSETILNASEPEEVIVVSLRRGKTVARRVKNPKRLKELINSSGFGLGFYYLSGSLDDA